MILYSPPLLARPKWEVVDFNESIRAIVASDIFWVFASILSQVKLIVLVYIFICNEIVDELPVGKTRFYPQVDELMAYHSQRIPFETVFIRYDVYIKVNTVINLTLHF